MRGWRAAALLAAIGLLLTCSVAGAARIEYILLASDTLHTHCADSCTSKGGDGGNQTKPYIDTGSYARMWVNFIATTNPDTLAALADTGMVLLVSVREVIPQYALGGGADTAAAWSDTTVVDFPVALSIASADADTVAYNTIAPAYGTPGSNEWRVVLNPAVTSAEVGDGVLRRWTARLELVNVMTGLPYRGKWTSIKWRMTSGPAIANLRVILGGETW
jgi:hypothetical protein